MQRAIIDVIIKQEGFLNEPIYRSMFMWFLLLRHNREQA